MFASLLAIILVLIDCAGKIDISKPIPLIASDNSVIVNKSKEEVWKKIVPVLGKQFFVINNLDKESGIINVSYKGDPEKYVDCGRIKSYVKNARGERTYDFSASKAYQEYEVMDKHGLFGVKRTMDLDGRINIIVEAISTNKTRVTVNIKYVLTRKVDIYDVQGRLKNYTETISFNTGQQSPFGKITCQGNGNLEKKVLSFATDPSPIHSILMFKKIVASVWA